MKEAHSQYIIHYLTVFNKWPMKMETNSNLVEVLALEAAGFKLEDGKVRMEQSSDLLRPLKKSLPNHVYL